MVRELRNLTSYLELKRKLNNLEKILIKYSKENREAFISSF